MSEESEFICVSHERTACPYCIEEFQKKEKQMESLLQERERKIEDQDTMIRKMYPCCGIHGQPSCLGCAADCSNAEAKVEELKERIATLEGDLKKISNREHFENFRSDEMGCTCDYGDNGYTCGQKIAEEALSARPEAREKK